MRIGKLILQYHGMIETLGKSDPESKVYGIYTYECRCMNVTLVQVFQGNHNAVL